jgi:hypothetical protein
MKKVFLLLFVSSIFCVATMANAQMVLKVNVPFEFVVRGKTLPAASYNIKRSLPDDSTGIAFLTDTEHLQIRATAMDAAIRGARLKFLKVGQMYFLTDVVTPTGTLHFPLARKDAQMWADAGSAAGTSIPANGR